MAQRTRREDLTPRATVRAWIVNACTLVIPCFNEAERLDPPTWLAWLRAHPHVRLLFVDDGSTDRTRERLDALATEGKDAVGVLGLDENQGKAEAVRRGVLEARKDEPGAFGYWDADLATPLDAVAAFLAVLDEQPRVHLVMGARVKLLGRDIRRRAARHYAGRVFATFASRVLDLAVYDTQCGAKVFRATPGTRALFDAPFRTRWLMDVEILARMRSLETPDLRLEEMVYELPLARWHDVAGSKLRTRDFVRAALDLARIRRDLRRAR
jgi:glycosyltransferase involved in cell wall biosynthesis